MLDRTRRWWADGVARISARPPVRPAFSSPCLHAAAALAIGDPGTVPRELVDAATGAQVVLAAYDALDAQLLARHRPPLVLSHVLGRGFDALDLAQRLCALEFQGRYMVLASGVPCPLLVRRELTRACPTLDVAVVVEGGALRRRAPPPPSRWRPRG